MWQFILERLSLIGSIPLCNGHPERAPHIFGYCFILCYRCTFILLLFGITLYYFRYRKIRYKHYFWLLLFPMMIDGSLQTFWGIESTNIRRILTGGLFGFALGILMACLYQLMDKRLLQKNSI